MVTMIVHFSDLSRHVGVGLLRFAHVWESCIDIISHMCTYKGIADSLSFVVNTRETGFKWWNW